MGCWNHTCAITKLPVLAGEEVVVFALKQKGYPGSHCEPTSYFEPMLYHFYGKYNDYGAVEECYGFGLPRLMERVRDELVELELGENQYHDIAVKKEGFGVEQFFDADHEARLFAKNIHHHRYPDSSMNHLRITHIVIRKNVFLNLLNKRKYSEYVGYNQKTGRSKYTHKSFDDVCNEVREAIRLSKTEYLKNIADGLPVYAALLLPVSTMTRDNNLLYWMFNGLHDGAIQEVSKLLESGAADRDISDFVYQLVSKHWLCLIMSESRSMWCPPSGAGSQSQEFEVQKLLADVTLLEIKEIKRLERARDEE